MEVVWPIEITGHNVSTPTYVPLPSFGSFRRRNDIDNAGTQIIQATSGGVWIYWRLRDLGCIDGGIVREPSGSPKVVAGISTTTGSLAGC